MVLNTRDVPNAEFVKRTNYAPNIFQGNYLEYHQNIDILLTLIGQPAENHQIPSHVLLPYYLKVLSRIGGPHIQLDY